MMTIKEFVEERGLGELDTDDISESLYSDDGDIETGRNFIKLYKMMCCYVDLEEYAEIFNDLVVLNNETNRDLCIYRGASIRKFKSYVSKNNKIFKLINEVLDASA